MKYNVSVWVWFLFFPSSFSSSSLVMTFISSQEKFKSISVKNVAKYINALIKYICKYIKCGMQVKPIKIRRPCLLQTQRVLQPQTQKLYRYLNAVCVK